MYTDKERSIKLKELGFNEPREKIWYKDSLVTVEAIMEFALKVDVDFEKVFPAYSADTLFEWLRGNTKDVNGFDYATPISPMTGMSIAKFNTGCDVILGDVINMKCETTLTNMLADAIIWILSQEAKDE